MSKAPIPILDDEAVWPLADMHGCIEIIRACLRARVEGRLAAPPRHTASFGNGDLVFTIGGMRASGDSHGVAGFRVYDTFRAGANPHTQIVAVWDSDCAKLQGLVLGEALGALRTGALGGVAVDLMASRSARIGGVLGTGLQARTQLMAMLAVRPDIQQVRVYSRHPERRAAFAEQMSDSLDREIIAVERARDAVEDADILLTATRSTRPVLETAWLKAGVHINSVGPKLARQHELPPAIGHLAGRVATDSPEQLRAYSDRHFLADTPAWERMLDLADLQQAAPAPRSPDTVSLFCSAGLAGTEVALAAELLRRAASGD